MVIKIVRIIAVKKYKFFICRCDRRIIAVYRKYFTVKS
ncbi:Uncharacterized protein dnm_014520 [Desulfonema magnum]|uniref:Uncharacterized protein n=1 Tax=Desulfonema magnum TaxID=45655 RepID=A0A975BHD0_9BACT|nr:Uncharacterized protein dnm_014520 [Desulfonema magnum]